MSASKRNGAEKKILPFTDTQIESALLNTKVRSDNLGAATVLTPSTIARLNAIEPLFKAARRQVGSKKSHYATLVRQKEETFEALQLLTSHFLQVFNLGARRGKYQPAERVLFGMDAHSEALPRLQNEADVTQIADKIVRGEAHRIAKGSEAMANPSAAEVEAKLAEFKNLKGLTSNANDAYGQAQKEVRKLYKEARQVIKRVWREVEVHFSEGSRERMRKRAREWGVHYERKGAGKVMKGTITDAATGQPLALVKVRFAQGKNKTLTDANGHFSFMTTLYHKQTLLATLSGYQPAEIKLILKEGAENVCKVEMVREK